MSDQEIGEEFTEEEQAALDAMEADTAPVTKEEQSEAKPEEAPQEETKEDEPAEGEEKPVFKSTREDKPPEGFVPHQAMHAERVKRQEAEGRIADLEARLAKLETPPEQEPQYVDPLEDPEGFRKWAEHNKGQQDQRWQDQQKAQEAQQKQQAEFAELQRFEDEFKGDNPDYEDAVMHLMRSRQTELAAQGYDANAIAGQISHEARGVFDAAKAAGLNPAEIIYMRAKKAGYRTPEPEKPSQPAEKMQALETAQKNTQGLGATGGPAQGKLTVEQIANMSEEELANLPEDQFRQAMGG